MIIFRIFFLLISHYHLLSIENNATFWIECCKYFNSIIAIHNGKLGEYFLSIYDTFSFNDSTVFKINNISHENKMKLNPSFFQKISGTVSLISFLIKDALEYCGVLYSDKATPPWKLIRNLNYDNEALIRLNKFQQFLKWHILIANRKWQLNYLLYYIIIVYFYS